LKYSVAKLLKDAAPRYVSGGDIARRFNVTRAAVWKCIEELREEGYIIEASTRKGYRLVSMQDCLNAFEIQNGLNTSVVGRSVVFLNSIDSTNSYAKRLALEGAENGTVVVAAEQTMGRGRLGRSWESPAGKGIYMSVLLKPDVEPYETPVLTLAAAVAVSDAIKEATGLDTGIKWPNDLVIDGKKVCGILFEMMSEADRVSNVILGIGINYSQEPEDFPAELKDRAISLKTASEKGAVPPCTTPGSMPEFSRLSVIRAVLKQLDIVVRMVINGRTDEVLAMWKDKSVTLGREVSFTLKGVQYSGVATDITGDGKLLVECSDGVRRELLSGEVSVRGIYGYA